MGKEITVDKTTDWCFWFAFAFLQRKKLQWYSWILVAAASPQGLDCQDARSFPSCIIRGLSGRGYSIQTTPTWPWVKPLSSFSLPVPSVSILIFLSGLTVITTIRDIAWQQTEGPALLFLPAFWSPWPPAGFFPLFAICHQSYRLP